MAYGFSWIIVVYHWITVDSNGLWTISGYRELQRFDMDYHGRSWMIMDSYGIWIIMGYRGLS